MLDIETSLEQLKAAARRQEYTTFGRLAKASDASSYREVWRQMPHHLDDVIGVCHDRSLPQFTSLCVREENRTTGNLDGPTLSGFIAGLRKHGYEIPADEGAFYRQCQQECFNWGRKNP